MRKADRERVINDLVSRVSHEIVARAGHRLDEAVADSVYHELRRLRHPGGDEWAFWTEVRDELHLASERTLSEIVRSIVRCYGDAICGTFDDRVYEMVTRTGEPLLGMLLNAVSPKRLLAEFPQRLLSLDKSIVIQGPVQKLHRLRQRGTLILVPPHVSNMDSIAVGWAMWKMGLPPFLYGAGLNLFDNPMLGFFMRNLGAYTVDRRKQDPLYKRVLKEYATLTLENGYDNIFFPGGTRSRSGALEKKLKLGLLGTGVSA